MQKLTIRRQEHWSEDYEEQRRLSLAMSALSKVSEGASTEAKTARQRLEDVHTFVLEVRTDGLPLFNSLHL